MSKRLYDQSLLCDTGCCPVVDDENGKLALHDPAFPAQGKCTFASSSELREHFDAAVGTRSLTVNDAQGSTYSFKDHDEMVKFGQNAFAALQTA